MRLLIDARLPRRTVDWFAAAGCDACHTLDLPLRNRTPDQEILNLAKRDQRILVTKDGDFVDSHLLFARPEKLLLVTTGNISNQELEHLMEPLIPRLVMNFGSICFWNQAARA